MDTYVHLSTDYLHRKRIDQEFKRGSKLVHEVVGYIGRQIVKYRGSKYKDTTMFSLDIALQSHGSDDACITIRIARD